LRAAIRETVAASLAIAAHGVTVLLEHLAPSVRVDGELGRIF